MRLLSFLLVVLAAFCYFDNSQAQSQSKKKEYDLSKVEIFLHTVDVGNLVYNNFGHTAIRVRDGNTGKDNIYNWGIFDFDNPLTFSANFYLGELLYQLGAYPLRTANAHYKYEKRSVWQDRINFSDEEKKIFLDRLEWNLKPENKQYLYQYFDDNCSTRPRDYIDEALGYQLKTQITDEFTGFTYRDFVRKGYALNPSMDMLLEIGMNGRLERPVSRWQSTFHPLYLRAELQAFKKANGEPLLVESKTLYNYETPSGFEHIFKLVACMLFVPVLILLIVFQKESLKQDSTDSKAKKLQANALRILGFIALPQLSYFGFCGLVMPLNWLFSGHHDLHHNLNMLFFLPFDILLLVPAFMIFVRKRQFVLTPKFCQIAKKYMVLHLVLLLASLFTLTGGHQLQDLSRVILVAIPYNMTIALLVNFGLKKQGEGKLDASRAG